MNAKLTYYKDDDGNSRVKSEAATDWPLVRFIDGDIQGNPDLCRRVLDNALSVKTGKKNEWKMIGNAFTTTVMPNKVKLVNHYQNTNAEITFDDFIQAVSGWLAFLESPQKRKDSPNLPR